MTSSVVSQSYSRHNEWIRTLFIVGGGPSDGLNFSIIFNIEAIDYQDLNVERIVLLWHAIRKATGMHTNDMT